MGTPVAAVPIIEEQPMSPADNSGVRRSGEHRASPETQEFIRAIEARTAADTRRDMLLEALSREVRELALEQRAASSSATAAAEALRTEVHATNTRLLRLEGEVGQQAQELLSFKETRRVKESAWVGILPAIITALVSSLLTAVVVGGIAHATRSPTPAPAVSTP
jgi:hypothetical protein